MQETQVCSLIQEDLTCPGGAKPERHRYWVCGLESGSCNYWADASQLLQPEHPRAWAPQPEKPPQWEAQAQKLESPPPNVSREKPAQQQWPRAAKNK